MKDITKCKFGICCPDLAMLIFKVIDKETVHDNLLSWYAIPVNCMRPGYRVVPLRDLNF